MATRVESVRSRLESSGEKRWSSDVRLGAVLALLALALYASGLRWGLPHATAPDRVDSWGVDDETPLGPLAEIHNIIEPKPDRNLGYPLMYSFLVTAAYSPYLGWLLATGRFAEPTPTYPFGLSDPVRGLRAMALIAHLLTTLMAVITVLSVYDAARIAWGRGAGMIAGLFAMTAYPMSYYARTGNVDVPMLCLTMLAFASFSRLVVLGHTTRRAVALGTFAGLALATKEAALGAFIAMPFVVLVLYRKQHPDRRRSSWSFWKPHAAALGTSFLALSAGSGLFVEPGRYIAHLRFLTGRLSSLAQSGTESASLSVQTFTYTLAGHLDYLLAIATDLADILTIAGLGLAFAGVVALTVRRDRTALLALPAATYILYMFLTLRSAQIRYMLPAALLLAGFAGCAAAAAWRSRHALVRVAGTTIAAAVLLVQSLRSADLTWQMIQDSRFHAADWLARNANDGDRIEYFGPPQKLPPLHPSWTTGRAAEYRGMYVPARIDDAKVREILQGWDERHPRFVIAIPDHTSAPGVPHSHTFPPQLFESMRQGRAGFRFAAYFRTRPLFPWLPPPRLDYPTVNPPIHIFEAIEERG